MQHQQRSARIDLIMKLFPENGNLSQATPAHITAQQSSASSSSAITLPPPNISGSMVSATAPLMPFILNNAAVTVDPLASHKIIQSMPLNSLIVADKKPNNTSYPHDMDCDPINSTTTPKLHPIHSGGVSATAAAAQNSRYNFLLSSLQGSASSGNLAAAAAAAASLGDAGDLHRNAGVLRDYAPASLPIGVFSSKPNNGALPSDAHSLAAYQHHLLVNSMGSNGNVSYIPYSMSSEAVNAAMPKNNSNTIASSSSLSGS